MAELWNEPFEQYADAAHMLNGTWAQVDAGDFACGPSTVNPRTGTTALRIYNGRCRRIFGGPQTAAGVEYALYLPNLPSNEDVVAGGGRNACWLGLFLDASAGGQVLFLVGTDGAVVAYHTFNYSLGGGFAVQIGRSAPCIVARAYNQIALKLGNVDEAAGTAEVRVNGVTVLNLSGVNTDPTGAGEVSQIAFQNSIESGVIAIDLDDMHAWNTSGDAPTDIVGGASVIYRPPVADTATADFALSAGSTGYSLLADGSDLTYISAGTSGKKSAFTYAPLPSDVVAVICQQLNWRNLKTSSGDCSIAPFFVSGGVEDDGAAQPSSAAETWQWWVEALDPNTAAPYTPAAANAATGGFDRTL